MNRFCNSTYACAPGTINYLSRKHSFLDARKTDRTNPICSDHDYSLFRVCAPKTTHSHNHAQLTFFHTQQIFSFRSCCRSLATALAYLAWSTLTGRRGEQRLVAQVLTAQGETLIRSVEAGGRVGMRRSGHAPFRLHTLLDELASQEDVLFLAIVRPDGTLEAQSQASTPSLLSQHTLASLFPADEPTWSLLTDASVPLFVVFRSYRPLLHAHHSSPFTQALRAPMCTLPPRQDQIRPFADADSQSMAVVAVALDARPYIQARRTDIITMSLAAALLLVVGAMAMAIWFWRRNALHLKQRVAQAEHLAAVGSLAAGVAHEIRNPLSSIKGFATVFQSKFPASSPEHDLAALMVGEVERLNRTVSGLLELSRVEQIQPSELNAMDQLDHALKLVEADCQAAGITVHRTPPVGSMRIMADRDRLLQVLLNMLLNAIQAMPHGGQLSVAVRQTGKTTLSYCRHRLRHSRRISGPDF